MILPAPTLQENTTKNPSFESPKSLSTKGYVSRLIRFEKIVSEMSVIKVDPLLKNIPTYTIKPVVTRTTLKTNSAMDC